MAVTMDQVRAVVKFQLQSIIDHKGKDVVLTDDTVLSEVLSETDGRKASNSKNVFIGAITSTLKWAKLKTRFPAKWMDKTVTEFAQHFVAILIFLICMVPARAQLEINLGAGKSELKNGFVNFGIRNLINLDSLYGGQDFVIAGSRSAFVITPDADIQFGTNDGFSSLAVKATGLLMLFKTTEVGGLKTPDLRGTFHTFPASLGIETNSLFSNVNIIGEFGYVPWVRGSDALKYLNFGAFIQVGRKIHIDSSAIKASGGLKDESLEAPNSTILRAKAELSIDSKKLFRVGNIWFGMLGEATAWYDAANGAAYHSIDGRVRMFLSDVQYLDFVYQHNAAEPNFTKGSQFMLNAVILLNHK